MPKVLIVARHLKDAEAAAQELSKGMAASIPLKRLGSVEDIGHAAAFLASKEAA